MVHGSPNSFCKYFFTAVGFVHCERAFFFFFFKNNKRSARPSENQAISGLKKYQTKTKARAQAIKTINETLRTQL